MRKRSRIVQFQTYYEASVPTNSNWLWSKRVRLVPMNINLNVKMEFSVLPVFILFICLGQVNFQSHFLSHCWFLIHFFLSVFMFIYTLLLIVCIVNLQNRLYGVDAAATQTSFQGAPNSPNASSMCFMILN